MKAKRILITRTDRLGDVVLSTPVIREVRKRYPDAYIAFMVRPANKDVIMHNPHIDEVITYDKYGLQKSFWSTVKFAFGLKTKKFDTAIALHPTNRVHLMLFLAGVPERIGYDRKLGFLLTKKVHHLKQEGKMHEVDYNLELLGSCGIDASQAERTPYIITSEEEKRLVDSVLLNRGIKRNIIAIHPGASCPSKRWSPEKFAKVSDELAVKYDMDIVIVGADDTSSIAERILNKMRTKAFDLTGTLLVGELAELLSRARLFISNDSGPVHVAVAVGTPVVSIFGRKDPGLSPKRWGPLGDSSIVIHKDPGCEVCQAHDCQKEFKCLEAIDAEDVLEASGELLSKP